MLATQRIAILLILGCYLPAQVPPQKQERQTLERRGFDQAQAPAVTFVLPGTWSYLKPSTRSRLLEWECGKPEPATGFLLWLGKEGAGTVEANLSHWGAQLEGKDPKPSKLAVGQGFQATLLDKSGTYVAEVSPGSPHRHSKPNYRLLACVLETPSGPLYMRLVGPEKVIEAERPAALAWLKSFEPKVATPKPADTPGEKPPNKR
mgnify:CR=1 FL=1